MYKWSFILIYFLNLKKGMVPGVVFLAAMDAAFCVLVTGRRKSEACVVKCSKQKQSSLLFFDLWHLTWFVNGYQMTVAGVNDTDDIPKYALSVTYSLI